MATYGSIRYSGVAEAGVITGTDSYTNTADLPTVGVDTGAMAYVSATNKLYMWNGSAWFNIAIVNQAPTAITGNQASYVLATDGTATTVTLVSTDPEGFPLTWSATTSGDTAVGTLTQADNVFTIIPSTNEADIGTLSVTFSVTDGTNTETSVSSFILAFLSPLWDETVLSIGTSSTDGLANGTFIDRSTNAYTVTPTGSPVQTAFHPYLDNWSLYNSDNNNGLYKDFGTKPAPLSFVTDTTSNGTIEAWIYLDQTPDAGGGHGGSTIVAIGDTYFAFLVTSSLKLRFYWWTGSQNTIDSTGTVSLHTWHHVAMVKDGDTIAFYIDGVASGTGTITTTSWASASNGSYLRIANNFGSGDTAAFKGYLSNLRLTDAIVYSGAFTPSTELLTAITDTTLLTCQSNRFIDNSSNAHAITVNGAPQISAFNPFGQESEYAVGENKGSVSLNRTSWLYAPTASITDFGTGDFTLQAWIYSTDTSARYQVLFDSRSSPTTETTTIGLTASFIPYIYNGTEYASSTAIKSNSWNHIVYVRDSSGLAIFLNGERTYISTSGAPFTSNLTGPGTNFNIGNSKHNDDQYGLQGFISDFKISKLALYSSSSTSISIPTAPVGNTNASLYLPFDNAGIFDKTGSNTLTLVGNTQTSNTQTKFADTAMYFDGSGDYIEIDNSSLFNFGASNFTIETWYKHQGRTGNYPSIISGQAWSSPAGGVALRFDNLGTSRVQFFWNGVGDPWLTSSSTFDNTSSSPWMHIALTREGNTFRIFVNGNLEATGTNTGSINFSHGGNTFIGWGPWDGANGYLNAYLENFQVLKGVAKYTTNFTPPDRTQGITYQAES